MSEEAKMDEKKEDKDKNAGLKKAVAFLTGVTLYQLPYLAISAGKFTLGRFKIPSSNLSLYINRMIIAYRVVSLIGIGSTTAYIQMGWPGKNELTSVLFWLYNFCFVLSLFVYCIGGELGYITAYYWTISLASLIFGLCYTTSVDIVAADVVCLLAAFPLTGVIISLYHILFLTIGEYFGIPNTNYWLVVVQMIIAILITGTNALLFTIAYWNKKDATGGDGGDPDPFMTAFAKAWSPILLITLGYGLQNAFYPGIAPYKLIGPNLGYWIDLTVLFTSAIPPLFILVLKEKEIGPNTSWSQTSGWHWSWLFFLVEIICATIFIWALHYPDWGLSQNVRSNAKLLGFLTVTYDGCVQFTRSIGTNGADMQGEPKKSNSAMNTFNSFTHSFAQVIFAFMGDGYMRIYSEHEDNRDGWPTKHYGNLRAFWFWTWNSTKMSYHILKTAFTTDLRSEVIGKKEFLFIVYADETDHSSQPPKVKNPTVMKIVHDI
ncbi:conserved hypothetical protein [Theileria equi strain WA]|uniref:Uncharacterized protein n=1 Tax=Theileria equi strain WA TaxID=1537102 RepID=L1LB31_THEEQ|nr:conserved hypothetical protein [Theileria equi strain WA]EKX72353.1 conserved hypothetical protein [Theileria equi strain WA]|eukprot:XP_004831805.1 conserved hypothetical protein [Theileria equi strain WA]